MSELATRIEDLKKLDSSIDQIVIDLIKDNEKLVIKMNLANLNSGINNKSEKLVPPYRPSTVKRKKRKGQPFNRVTLKDEGDFHEGFFVEYGEDEFSLQGDDPKTRYLIRKYGNDIFGLTEENIDELKNKIRERLTEEIKKRILK